ncbi:MAG: type II toxin-antitoxin system RelE/ParE family toxin [bacterium]
MLNIKIEKQFKKDAERDKVSGKYSKLDFETLKSIIINLQEEKSIDLIYKRHNLKGNFNGYETIHIKNDWLLIFKIDTESQALYLVALGTHNQVFKKLY